MTINLLADFKKLLSITILWVHNGYLYTVLLISGERRKVVELPAGVADRYYDYLRCVFVRTFSAKGKANVHFQCYDRECEEWIDLDEDFVAVDRERIKVVVESSLDLCAAKSQAEVTTIFRI